MSRPYRQQQDAVRQELRNDPAQASAYLRVALEEFEQDGDRDHLLTALQNVITALQDDTTTS